MAALGPETKYRLLLEISRKISRTLELQDLLDQILDSVRLAIPYDAGGIFVLHESVPLAPGPIVDLIAGMAQIGFDDRPSSGDPMLRTGQGIVGHVIRTGGSVLAPDVRLDPRYVRGRASTRSEIAVPVVSNALVIGALNLESDRCGAFMDADVELLQFFAVAAAIAIEKALLHRQMLEKQRIQHQLRIARDVQESLLPAAPPELKGYDIAAVNLPTWEIGGDYYDYLPLSDGRLALVVADVSGKGVAAALILLLDSPAPSRFVTAVYGTLDPDCGRFDYVNCGPGDVLALYTDGVVELSDAEETEYGLERLERALRGASRRPARDMVLSVVDATRAFGGRVGYADDFTLVVVKREERPGPP